MLDWPAPDIWMTPLGEWLEANLTTAPDEFGNGWQDYAMSAYQMGCMALEKLGRAKQEKWGASALKQPETPDVAPRWDDICAAVLGAMDQRSLIRYRRTDGSIYVRPSDRGQFMMRVAAPKPPPPPAPNVRSSVGLGPADVADGGLDVLTQLGLVKEGAWTARAEFVFWREMPPAWDLEIAKDTRFADATDLCLASMPEVIGTALEALTNVSSSEIDDKIAWHTGQRDNLGHLWRPLDRDWAKRSMLSVKRSRIDDIFYEGWRLQDGWLSDADKRVALFIFHDPLAHRMRKAVVAKMFPTSDMAKEDAA